MSNVSYILKKSDPTFGGASLNESAIDWIDGVLKEGDTIVELGSGEGSTIALGKKYNLYSVENQPVWKDRFPEYTTYINCRSKEYDDEYTKPEEFQDNISWYHPDDLFPNLPEDYDLILIDGPGGIGHGWGRGGFWKHIEKFKTDVHLVFDDAQREIELIKLVSNYVGRDYILLDDGVTGVIREA